jgi:hypothetical protein
MPGTTFNANPETLPPLTKAIREAWIQPGPNQPSAPYPNAAAFNAILDAVHDL